MKGTFFGYEEHTPCPSCGTPRVLADCDDDARIIPGRLIPATCNKWEIYITPFDIQKEGSQQWVVCPKCKTKIYSVDWKENPRWTSFRDPKYYVRCPNSRTSVERLPGCPKCRESAHHFGLGVSSTD